MREELCLMICDMWREAENHYLDTGEDWKKWDVKDYQDSVDLTDEEVEYIESVCNSIGI